MIEQYALYDALGAILYMVYCTEAEADLNVANDPALVGWVLVTTLGVDPSTHYVENGNIVAKVSQTPVATITTGQAVLTALPDPCVVAVLGQAHPTTGGTVTLTFDAPGTYAVRVTAEPKYLPADLTLDIP